MNNDKEKIPTGNISDYDFLLTLYINNYSYICDILLSSTSINPAYVVVACECQNRFSGLAYVIFGNYEKVTLYK